MLPSAPRRSASAGQAAPLMFTTGTATDHGELQAVLGQFVVFRGHIKRQVNGLGARLPMPAPNPQLVVDSAPVAVLKRRPLALFTEFGNRVKLQRQHR